MQVREIMSSPAITVRPETKIQEVGAHHARHSHQWRACGG